MSAVKNFVLRHSNIAKIFAQTSESSAVVKPTMYLAANSEILFGTICLCLFITWVFNGDFLSDNEIRKMVGYNNPCVAWDSPPALYVGAFCFTFTTVCAARYAQLDSKRAYLTPDLPERTRLGIRVVNIIYLVSQATNMGIFVVTPDGSLSSMRFHSACFLQLVPALGMCIGANYLEEYWGGTPISTVQWVVLGSYLFLTFWMTVLASIAVFAYENDGVPVVNPVLMWIVDWAWFVSLPIVAKFMPETLVLKVEYTVVEKAEALGRPAEEPGAAKAEAQGMIGGQSSGNAA